MISASLSHIIFHKVSFIHTVSENLSPSSPIRALGISASKTTQAFPLITAWPGFKAPPKCHLFLEAYLDCPLKSHSPLAASLLGSLLACVS